MARSCEKPSCGTVNGGIDGPNIVWYFGGQTLEGFANIVSGNLDRHVLDKTGVPGNFIIFLEFVLDENSGASFRYGSSRCFRHPAGPHDHAHRRVGTEDRTDERPP